MRGEIDVRCVCGMCEWMCVCVLTSWSSWLGLKWKVVRRHQKRASGSLS